MNKYLKSIIYILLDILIVSLSYYLIMRVLSTNIKFALEDTLTFLLIGVGVVVLINALLGLYTGIWAFAGFWEAIRLGFAAILFMFYNMFVSTVCEEVGYSWAVISTLFTYMLIFITRFIPRFKNSLRKYLNKKAAADGYKKVLLVGAGSTGAILIKELRTSTNSDMDPVCALDDDEEKINRYVSGVKVVGTTYEIDHYAKKYGVQEIIIAMPTADKKVISRIVKDAQKTGCKVKTISGIMPQNAGRVSVADIKEVGIDDLLGREQVRVNLDDILGYIEGKTVLVTGGGGSIGSELCRQIATHNPKLLIIVDIYENNAYDIEQELIRNLPNLNLLVLIASVRDKRKINNIFEEYRPEIVFHAAAHKHVPLMETSPNEAVKNNVIGTLNVTEAAGKYGTQRFVMISTDKAVNPTNVMGATKRICEMIIQAMDKKYATEYVAVRFGNVLGSNGSVIPLFKRQIKEGGPVTVTHKDIVRYFMTIPEAVSLVLQAGAYAKGGEIFVLNMGEPVRIYDLAENLIRLSGFEPNVDIDIKVIGLRPGEKLYEERLMEEEGLQETENKMISIGKPLEIDKDLFEKVKQLGKQADGEVDNMKELVSKLVPTYKIDLRNKK
ncbi:MAG: polysaccharide biosynthesis protein [Clostridiales bacterium]|nr:polysaccharide biosynthesis protein [Clostridiales bacterium]